MSESSRDKGSKEQESIMQRATNAYPTYNPRHFLTRDAVNKWMRRMDTPDKLFYVYVFTAMGQPIGYYVAQTRPVSACTFLTPPDRIVYANNGRSNVVQAPALDGVYYGQGGCDRSFFFDATTDAFIELPNGTFHTADQPLSIEAGPIQVELADEE